MSCWFIPTQSRLMYMFFFFSPVHILIHGYDMILHCSSSTAAKENGTVHGVTTITFTPTPTAGSALRECLTTSAAVFDCFGSCDRDQNSIPTISPKIDHTSKRALGTKNNRLISQSGGKACSVHSRVSRSTCSFLHPPIKPR